MAAERRQPLAVSSGFRRRMIAPIRSVSCSTLTMHSGVAIERDPALLCAWQQFRKKDSGRRSERDNSDSSSTSQFGFKYTLPSWLLPISIIYAAYGLSDDSSSFHRFVFPLIRFDAAPFQSVGTAGNMDSPAGTLTASPHRLVLIHHNGVVSSYRLAPRFVRVLCAVLDSLLVVSVSCALLLVAHLCGVNILQPIFRLMSLPLSIGLELWWHYKQGSGQTFGKAALGVKTLKENGAEIGAGEICVNSLLKILNVVDWIFALFNIGGKYQCLHNIATRTVVILKEDEQNNPSTAAPLPATSK